MRDELGECFEKESASTDPTGFWNKFSFAPTMKEIKVSMEFLSK